MLIIPNSNILTQVFSNCQWPRFKLFAFIMKKVIARKDNQGQPGVAALGCKI
jgi:hypothetical protein